MLGRERKPLDGWFVVVVFVAALVTGLALAGTGLGWWASLGVQTAAVFVALLGWSLWPTRR